MKLTKEEVLHIARLARLAVTDEEVTRYVEQLSNLLEHFQVLQGSIPKASRRPRNRWS